MMKHTMRSQPTQAAQRGAALIVGLIMLLLLTLIGVAGMRDTLLQQKMVANSKDREAALQSAESALRAAEDALGKPSVLAMTGSGGLYNVGVATPPTILQRGTYEESAFWRQWNWAANSIAYGFSLVGVDPSNPPRYVVEQLPKGSAVSGGSSGSGSSGVTAEDWRGDDGTGSGAGVDYTQYRITARGIGRTTDAVVFLQSTFRRGDTISSGP
ncbi:MAG: PilX N-terminal domain-containing pilus assembly protein [Pseudomonadales bacterium]|jgi:type IV pilus assembly protein PilX